MQTDTQVSTPSVVPTRTSQSQPALSAAITATAPGELKVIKRNGTVVPYTHDKIAVAMTKAFLAVEGGTAAASPRIRELVSALTLQVTDAFKRRLPSGGTLHIEDIQDQVELALMRSGEHKVARSYVLYRAERARLRDERAADRAQQPSLPQLHVTQADGTRVPLDTNRLRQLVREACEALSDVDPERIINEALKNMYDGIAADDVATSTLITARTLVEEEPNYTFVSARLLMDELRTEALTFLGVQKPGAAPGDFRAVQSEMDTI
ncbi:MAG: ATP cone domain-containing protein, partial [Pseudomonadales bacterium]